MLQDARPQAGSQEATQSITVRHLRQALLWPLRLMTDDDVAASRALAVAARNGRGLALARALRRIQRRRRRFPRTPLQRVRRPSCPTCSASCTAKGRAQRGGDDAASGSPMRVFRRRDIAAVRVVPRPGDAPDHAAGGAHRPVLLLRRRHRAAERGGGGRRPAPGAGAGTDVPLRPRLPGRLGRRRPRRCTAWPACEWLDSNGHVLARSDAQDRDSLPGPRGRAPRAAHRGALGLRAGAAGQPPLGARRARCAFARSSTTACR